MTLPDRRTALLVHAHPEAASFTTAQAKVARASLEAQGYRVSVVDLYGREWDPVLTRKEFPPFEGPFKPQREQWNAVRAGTLPLEIRAHLDLLFESDLLVLSFPLWWFSVPAILKGWLDRVLVMGAVSGGDVGVFADAALVGRRAVVLATTGGPAEVFTTEGAFGHVDDFLFPLQRGVLEFVGYDALRPVITFGPAHLDDLQRQKALDEVRQAFDTLDERPSASTSRSPHQAFRSSSRQH
jgi:NAD(P)H dehydrogenase (quinone)